MTRKVPFPDFTDPNATVMISKDKRPPTPRRSDALGTSKAIWKVATKCWHDGAKDRPEVDEALHDLEKILNPDVCTRKTCTCEPWESIDYGSEYGCRTAPVEGNVARRVWLK